MDEFDYLITHCEKFINQYGKQLHVGPCELRISDYSFKSPQASANIIQFPIEYLQLLNLNSRLILRNQNILKGFGNSKIEVLNKGDFILKDQTLTLNDFLLQNKLNDKTYYETPIDNRRNKISYILDLLLNSFILYHELGHVRQLNYKLNSQEVNIEFGTQDNTVKWEQQAMEVDADIFALNMFLNNVFYNVHQFTINDIFTNTKELILVATYAIFLFFYMSNTSDGINDPLKSHPHPLVRFAILGNYLQVISIENNLFNNLEDFNKFIQDVLREFDNTLTYHFNIPNNKLYYQKFSDPLLKEVILTLQEYVRIDPSLNSNRPYKL